MGPAECKPPALHPVSWISLALDAHPGSSIQLQLMLLAGRIPHSSGLFMWLAQVQHRHIWLAELSYRYVWQRRLGKYLTFSSLSPRLWKWEITLKIRKRIQVLGIIPKCPLCSSSVHCYQSRRFCQTLFSIVCTINCWFRFYIFQIEYHIWYVCRCVYVYIHTVALEPWLHRFTYMQVFFSKYYKCILSFLWFS